MKNTLKRFVLFLMAALTVGTACITPAFAESIAEAAPVRSESAAFAKKVPVKSVKLNKSSLTLDPGESFQLKATISPSNASSKSVAYSSSNAKVATVDSKGKIVAKAVGTAKITAKTNNGKTASVTVKVVKTTVKLNKTKLTMLGKPIQLKATVSSNSAVAWTSSDPKVAAVSSKGVVTPKGYGTCTITAKAKNATAVCTVEVKKTNTITKTYTVVADDSVNIYKAADTLTVVVDGLTGKIKSTDCYQSKRDASVIGFFSKDGIKCYQKDDDCAYFRSTYTLNLGLIGIGKLKLGFEAITVTYYYKLYNDGTLKYMRGECDDLLKVCQKDSTYWTIDSKGNIVKTDEKR